MRLDVARFPYTLENVRFLGDGDAGVLFHHSEGKPFTIDGTAHDLLEEE